uniref:Calmodulin-lysine N-methyltransferase n=1 Tax=Aureoumbra lagunensis TaxID=44058 RepID=A0A7S3JTP3_9STRA
MRCSSIRLFRSLFLLEDEKIDDFRHDELRTKSKFKIGSHCIRLKRGEGSTGGSAWYGATLLAEYLNADPELKMAALAAPNWSKFSLSDARTIELGAGLGLTSIITGILGANAVLATDGSTSLIPILQANLETNLSSNQQQFSNVCARHLDWRDLEKVASIAKSFSPNLIIGSDLVYGRDNSFFTSHLYLVAAMAILAKSNKNSLVMYAHTTRFHGDDSSFWRHFDHFFVRTKLHWSPTSRESFYSQNKKRTQIWIAVLRPDVSITTPLNSRRLPSSKFYQKTK